MACRILVLGPGSNLGPVQWKCGVLTPETPGKSPTPQFKGNQDVNAGNSGPRQTGEVDGVEVGAGECS